MKNSKDIINLNEFVRNQPIYDELIRKESIRNIIKFGQDYYFLIQRWNFKILHSL